MVGALCVIRYTPVAICYMLLYSKLRMYSVVQCIDTDTALIPYMYVL
jgi:hypothetical protein